MQPVCTDDEIESPWRAVLERDVAVVGDRGDLVAEHILDVVTGCVVIDLAEVVAHDLDVPVGHCADEFEVVDTRRFGRPRPAHRQHRGPGGVVLDARQHTHPLRDLHRGAEQVDGVAAGLAQRWRAFDHRHVETAAGQPVGQRRAGDAGAADQDRMASPSDFEVSLRRRRAGSAGSLGGGSVGPAIVEP